MKKLRINGRSFYNEAHQPFFYTACTAWELFHKLTLEEAGRYLINRAEKGFNVVQAVAVCELDGLHTPTLEGGHLPFADLATLEPNDTYFSHVRKVTEMANHLGIYVALVPMWGSHWSVNNSWGRNKTPLFNKENVHAFCRYLSDKMAGTGILWMIGGDRAIATAQQRDVLEEMAMGLRAGACGDALITVHSQGGRSTLDMLGDTFQQDFVVWQTGHMGQAYPSWRPIEMDYQRLDKPVLDSEPCYEAHPVMCQHQFRRAQDASRFTDREIRRTSYWSVFAGGAGITYGCYSLWQMRRPEDDAQAIPESAASTYQGDTIPYWFDALNYPGAFNIGTLRRFIEALPEWWLREPDQSLLLGQNATDGKHCRAMRDVHRRWIAVYIPEQQNVVVDVRGFAGSGFEIGWFDPRYGVMNWVSSDISETFFLSIDPPQTGTDWVLVLRKKS